MFAHIGSACVAVDGAYTCLGACVCQVHYRRPFVSLLKAPQRFAVKLLERVTD